MIKNSSIEVREMTAEDIPDFVNYWLHASPEFLTGMGVDIKKRPNRAQLENLIHEQLSVEIKQRKSYSLTWLINGSSIGYSNVNQIKYGKEAFMHLHLWESQNRQKGIGSEFIKRSLPYYFNNLQLQTLYCEPYALNPAPNKTVEKLGFEFVKKYTTIPGASNFEQEVNRWELTRKKYVELTIPRFL